MASVNNSVALEAAKVSRLYSLRVLAVLKLSRLKDDLVDIEDIATIREKLGNTLAVCEDYGLGMFKFLKSGHTGIEERITLLYKADLDQLKGVQAKMQVE